MIALFVSLAGHVLAADDASHATFKAGSFTFTRPAKWGWEEPASSMRAAQLKIQGKDSATAEALFFYFGPGNGGGTDANIERWVGQFKEPREQLKLEIKAQTIGGHKVTYFQAQGTYLSGMPGAPTKTAQPGSMLKGAILEHPDGAVFIRITGPIDLVKQQDADLKKTVEKALSK